ncbi:Spt20 family-domain-containing protein [Phycomyces blakesleeanus]|uniref:Spt20-like SEP domain-containing protein n=2 Tax=Phycomyces blakesleeanus TaxID=4837 RepID=A0A162UPJ5_PHYB8|nr:hypothetical protein PHYBLDRAFT_164226 [Phycomyces blakesleeanus NRRL 1555(-)]OAD77312.1 hypothetical protein PHYBLDRAFT_164226 [Phycomyces blakesleeanus NRRL 1555(-)]|eukprot:XP_018295352.1 hypothetical protein PHYBLDRAFT_164226 [Phycomyces blakesleeanus NRRL 1555(-)]
MASAKLMAKLHADQSAVAQLAEFHSRQGSSVVGKSASRKAPIARPVSQPQSTEPTQRLSRRDEKDLIQRHANEPPSLVLHLYPTYFKFEHEDGFFSYKSQFKILIDFLSSIKNKQLPADLMDVFDEASCRYYEGCLIVEIHDHRSPKKFHTNGQNGSQSDSETQVKRLAMQPTAESLWTDIHLLSEEWGFPWTEQVAVEVEAKILLATEEPLCLDPSFQVSRISNAMEQWNRVRRPKKKQKWNSLEREQKLAKKAEDVKAMTIMDTRAKREFPFEPSFGKISFVQDWRSKKHKQSEEPLGAVEVKKSKGRKVLVEPPAGLDGRKCVRTIRFERNEDHRKVYTVINIYAQGETFDGVFCWGTTPDTSLNGGNIE